MRFALALFLAGALFAQQPVTQGPRATTTAAWLVDGTGGVFPVTGTFWQATQPVSAAALPLPSGAATEATLATLNGKVTAVNTGAVVVASSALPSGASTAAKQDTEIASLASIDGKLPALGQALAAASVPIVLTAAQITTLTPVSTVTANQGTSPWIVGGGGTAGSAATAVVTIQGIASMTKLLVTPDANSAVNVSQINGVTPLMGGGNTGTGSPRVTVVTDNAAVALWGHGATGSAVPANATYAGVLTAGNLAGIIGCRSSKVLNMTTATTTEMVAASGSTAVYICSIAMEAAGTTTATLKYGTGTNCDTGTAALGAAWEWTAQTGIARGNGLGILYATPASQAVCMTNSGSVNLHVEISYTQY